MGIMCDDSFDQFETRWAKKLSILDAVLRELHKSPEVLENWGIVNLIRPDEVINFQKNWLRLFHQFGEIEKSHFRDYWVPGENDNYGYFIDLSSEKLTMMSSFYHFEYHVWVPFSQIDLCDIVINYYSPSEIREMHDRFTTEVTSKFIRALKFKNIG